MPMGNRSRAEFLAASSKGGFTTRQIGRSVMHDVQVVMQASGAEEPEAVDEHDAAVQDERPERLDTHGVPVRAHPLQEPAHQYSTAPLSPMRPMVRTDPGSCATSATVTTSAPAGGPPIRQVLTCCQVVRLRQGAYHGRYVLRSK